MRQHAGIKGGLEPLPQSGAIINNPTCLILEADDAHSELPHERHALYSELAIDFAQLKRIGEGGAVEAEPAS